MTLAPTVRRVLGGGPFAEIGEPALAVVDERSRTVAVGGDLGHVQWMGSGTADSRWTGHRIGVYEQDGLRCRRLVRSWYPVRSLAFHPTLPLLAVGTGRYDGGYSFEGELLLIHLDSGDVVSALPYRREVLGVEWRSETALRLVMAPFDDWENPQAHEQGHAVVVVRSDWGAVGRGAIRAEELAAPAEPVVQPDHSAEARRILTDLAASADRQWSVRRRVWAVEGTEDGRVLAALDGVLAESWLPSGDLQWAVEDEEGGRQLVPASDGSSIWANAERRNRRKGRRWETGAPRVARIAVDTGQVLETLSPGVLTVLVAGGRRTILRPLDGRRKHPERLMMFDLDGPVSGPEVGHFDLFNHPFAVRRASRPYVLVGTDPDAPHRGKWVTALGADGTLRWLFPHSWVPEEHHFGGPAVEIGQSLVCAGAVHHGQGLQTGGAYVVRRSLDGSVQWQHRTDHPATALDTDGDTVYAAYNSGALTALDAEDGSVRWHTELEVEGAPTTALSLAVTPQGHLLIGTVDGRILEFPTRQ
ncbi:PQQ-binding-like beta-propeller repeat protein [Streptomyces sp. NBC_00347]|uniref:outer membrane protein assembly factor BamB family protein n=1 Tax=Streptomyces sp. NBC_00347 TaxID=2975721 RepID=UPI0022544A0A|nr:PQQ-binding-like beta-propeller repeat protein [Streptomyces sp. NBC_00347]MCX5129281.1 PQQ-binding-like beta-propeller repeat protein [Streptomyces sp. NBC_00347]